MRLRNITALRKSLNAFFRVAPCGVISKAFIYENSESIFCAEKSLSLLLNGQFYHTINHKNHIECIQTHSMCVTCVQKCFYNWRKNRFNSIRLYTKSRQGYT